jgi:23S rRNA (cytidine1920-2'-O)/16S rRNA (cytidine1409-2'-O)-methyltransferase
VKQRVDALLAAGGLAPSREQAQRLIMAGHVYVDEVKVLKPSQLLEESANLIVRGQSESYASRGAHKIEKALSLFAGEVTGLVCMDIGAASGGFTDALLRRGAALVYAIDVGYGQLEWRLRQDPRVMVMERTNARQLLPEHFPQKPSLCVMDVSFISIRLIMPVAAAIMGQDGRFLTLIKPQFEAGRGQVGKNGVVRQVDIHTRVLREIRDFCPGIGWTLQGLTWSPIKGPKGNIEFLADIRPGPGEAPDDAAIRAMVDESHEALSSSNTVGV